MGSAERELERAGVRYTLALRFVVVLLCGLATLIFDTAPEPAAAVAVVGGLGAWSFLYVVRFRRRGRWLVGVDVAVTCLVCLSQEWTAPAASTEGMTWVSGVAGITVITYAWQFGWGGYVTATLAVTAAYLAGAALADPQGVELAQVWIVVQSALSRLLYLMVRRGARIADAVVEHGARVRQEAAVAEARRADEREYLAALHDTASATLLMVGAGVVEGRCAWLSEQAGRDLDVISGQYRMPSGAVDLGEHLRELVRTLPLSVRWDAPEPVVVPAAEVSALSYGVREALNNVIRHAGVDAATVSLRRNGDSVLVEVADAGVGIDPAGVKGHGLTRSLGERMARAGGAAEVISGPGGGTRVRLIRTLAPPAPPVGNTETINGNVAQGLRWAVVGINLVILFGLQLPKLLADRDSYEPLWAQVLAMAALTGVTLVFAQRLWRQRPLDPLRWPLAVVVLVAAIIGTASVPPDLRLGIAHWSEAGAAWSLVLVLMDAGPVALVAGLAVHYAVTFWLTALGGAAGISLGEAVTSTVIVVGYQLAVGIAAAVLLPIARTAARVAGDEERLRTEQASAELIHDDRTRRYAGLGDTTGPLLAGLASSELDPGDVGVRRSCAVEAARMRRLFAEDASAPDPLLSELRACVELVERNGVTVQLAELGERPPMPDAVRRALTEPAVAALATAASTARVTVIGAADTVTVSVVADAPADVLSGARLAEVELTTATDADKIRVKATWRRPA